jgi:hypothetical protein
MFFASHAQAQRVDIEFDAGNVISTVHIAPTVFGYNGISTPITFNPLFRQHPIFNGFIITTTPIDVAAARYVSIDLQGATTIPHSDSEATKGLLTMSVNIIDATTGAVLQSVEGFSTMMQSLKPGNDTSTTRNLTIDLSTMQAHKVILQFCGVSILTHYAPAHITFDNNGSSDLE